MGISGRTNSEVLQMLPASSLASNKSHEAAGDDNGVARPEASRRVSTVVSPDKPRLGG